MTAVQKIETPSQELGEVRDISGGLLEVIARAVRDPSVDIDKMERLFALQERIMERDAKMAFVEAKRAMRPELPIITQKGHIVIRDKNDPNKIIQDTPFAKFEDINEAVMPIVTRHGFDLAFKNGLAPDGKVRVTTILSHTAGHAEDTYFDLPHDSSGSKNAVQAIGSSTSYAKRYGVIAILNLTIMGEDDDGVKGGAPATLSEKQASDIEALIEDVGADRARFLKFMKVASVDYILASDYQKTVAALEAKRAK